MDDNSIFHSCNFDAECFLYQVVHMVYINHLHFEDYDHVHQNFAENYFGIYKECCDTDIYT